MWVWDYTWHLFSKFSKTLETHHYQHFSYVIDTGTVHRLQINNVIHVIKKGVVAEKAWLHFTKITNSDSCNIWNDYFNKGEKHQQYTETPFYATWDSLREVPSIWCSSTATFSMSSHCFTHKQKALPTCYIGWENWISSPLVSHCIEYRYKNKMFK